MQCVDDRQHGRGAKRSARRPMFKYKSPTAFLFFDPVGAAGMHRGGLGCKDFCLQRTSSSCNQPPSGLHPFHSPAFKQRPLHQPCTSRPPTHLGDVGEHDVLLHSQPHGAVAVPAPPATRAGVGQLLSKALPCCDSERAARSAGSPLPPAGKSVLQAGGTTFLAMFLGGESQELRAQHMHPFWAPAHDVVPPEPRHSGHAALTCRQCAQTRRSPGPAAGRPGRRLPPRTDPPASAGREGQREGGIRAAEKEETAGNLNGVAGDSGPALCQLVSAMRVGIWRRKAARQGKTRLAERLGLPAGGCQSHPGAPTRHRMPRAPAAKGRRQQRGGAASGAGLQEQGTGERRGGVGGSVLVGSRTLRPAPSTYKQGEQGAKASVPAEPRARAVHACIDQNSSTKTAAPFQERPSALPRPRAGPTSRRRSPRPMRSDTAARNLSTPHSSTSHMSRLFWRSSRPPWSLQ